MAEPKWKAKYGDSAVYRLNEFVQDKLQEMEFIDMSRYKSDFAGDLDTGLPFMVPGQDFPEMTTMYDEAEYLDLPYCIYSFSHRPTPDEPYMQCGQVAYSFMHGDVDTLIGLAEYSEELLKREDWTAADINYHFRANADYAFEFKNVSVQSTAGPAPTGDEGGRSSFMVVARFDATYEGPGRNYTQDLSNSLTFEQGMR